MARTIIVILGMHRCGTSAVGGAVARLGAALPRRLLEARRSNPKGHFEGRQIVWLNEQILRQVGSSWDDPRPIPREVFRGPAFELTVDLVVSCIESEFDGNPSLMVIKDPRICLLAPIWIEAIKRIGAELHVFYPFRAPSQVAASLFRRDGKDVGLALSLWSNYVLAAEYHSRGTRRAFFDADDFVRDPAAVLRAAGETTGMCWPVPHNEIETLLGDFVDPALLSKNDENGVAATAAQCQIYEELTRLRSDPDDAEAMAAFDAARRSQIVDAGAPTIKPAMSAEHRNAPVLYASTLLLHLQRYLLMLCRHSNFFGEKFRSKIGRFAIKRILKEAWKRERTGWSAQRYLETRPPS